jgi:uncharacterized membrane protein
MATEPAQAARYAWMKQPWSWFAIAMALTAFGFAPSFYSALLITVPPHILIHGITATLWMALPVLQGLLIAKRKRNLHRKIGYFSLALAAVVVLSGLRVVQTMVQGGGKPVELVSYKFVLLDLTGIAMFAVFLALAIRAAKRYDLGLHLRLMACTAIIPLEAANERTALILFPGIIADFDAALYASLFSMEAICLGLILAEWRLDRIRWPFTLMLGYYLLMHLIATPVALDPGFQAFSQWYAHLGG